jgi:pyruvate-formate lyase-activating enzyme
MVTGWDSVLAPRTGIGTFCGVTGLPGLARWIKTELGPDVPLHFSRFHPQYLLKNLPPTALGVLERAKRSPMPRGCTMYT